MVPIVYDLGLYPGLDVHVCAEFDRHDNQWVITCGDEVFCRRGFDFMAEPPPSRRPAGYWDDVGWLQALHAAHYWVWWAQPMLADRQRGSGEDWAVGTGPHWQAMSRWCSQHGYKVVIDG